MLLFEGNLFLVIYIFGAFSNSFLFPLSQLLMLGTGAMEDMDVMNPYLPHIFYQPYDTSTPFGFCLGLLLGALFFSYLYGLAVSMNWMYLSFAVQIRIHFQVLNHSIDNIHRRAFLMYSKRFGLPGKPKLEDVSDNKEFQACLYSCLKSNIQHHQALIGLMKTFDPFLGSYLLDLFTIASSVFGALLYLINRVPPINYMISHVVSFIAEQFSIIYVCMLGQDVIEESERVFHRLYNISWFHYDRRFTQSLRIMMSKSMKGMGLRTLLVGAYACLEAYGDIISAMYKILNIVRQSDVV